MEAQGGLVALFGNLAPQGAILKRSAADPKLFEHEGRAVVFSSLEDLAARMDDPALDVSPQDLLVLQNAGPHSPSCMPEAGYLPIPKKLAKQGVKDMIRISDARMSGTSYGACILHVAPESFVGGPLAFVRTGDEIEIDVNKRRIHLHVSDEELARRKAAWRPPPPKYPRGYGALHAQHIGQADEGCDFDFLAPLGAIPEPEIH
jgi:dihydroxy-acid dehydratase